MSEASAIAAEYRRRADHFAAIHRDATRRAAWLANARMAAFLGVVMLIAAAWFYPGYRLAAVVGAVLAFAAFALLVRWHGRVEREVVRSRGLRQVNEQSIARMERRWSEIPLPAVEAPQDASSVARDLDLLGRASLFHLLGSPGTPHGLRTLRDWLISPSQASTIKQRQQAVARLAPELDYRQELQFRGSLLLAARAKPGQFADWAEGPSWLARRRGLHWFARLSPLVGAALLLLDVTDVWSQKWWLILWLVNLAVTFSHARSVHGIFNRVGTRHGEVEQYCGLFEWMHRLPRGGEYLDGLHQQVASGRSTALRAVLTLRRIMDGADLRYSAMIYPFVQAISMYDFHILAWLERWQVRCGSHVREWFEALADLEATAALAALAHDNPAWCYPTIQPDDKRLTARAMGHPLIVEQHRVSNDVEVGPPGTFLLVTGSNMSGKSTLLRSIGTNVALAQAGAPVCAEQMALPPLQIRTSMRVQDSLEDGVSFFMAELKRLKGVVDAARQLASDGEWTLLFLLDEILQGTNTRERQIAVRTVVSHLLQSAAIGAISTHDLELASGPPLADACRTVHFRETFHEQNGRPQMTFDYLMRPGLAPSTNALQLLAMVGLTDPVGEESE